METINVFYYYDILSMEHRYLFTGFMKTETFDYFKNRLKPYCSKLEVVGDKRNELLATVYGEEMSAYKARMLYMIFVEPPKNVHLVGGDLIFNDQFV